MIGAVLCGIAAAAGPGVGCGLAADPRPSQGIAARNALGDGGVRDALQEPITLESRAEPVREVLRAIRDKIGVPLLLDPSAASRADESVTLKADGMRAAVVLEWALRQAGLSFEVGHGAIRVAAERPVPLAEDEPPDPLPPWRRRIEALLEKPTSSTSPELRSRTSSSSWGESRTSPSSSILRSERKPTRR